MIGKDQLAEIVRNHDALAEEHGLSSEWWGERFDVDDRGLMYVAMQRALRVVMLRKGLNINVQEPTRVMLTPNEITDQGQFAAIFLDGFAAGMEAERRKQ